MEEKMVDVCDLWGGCGSCPFNAECGIDFRSNRSQSRWIEELEERIENLQWLLDKVRKA